MFKSILTLAGPQEVITSSDCSRERCGLNNCRWLTETSFCSFCLPNVTPVETFDPVAFCAFYFSPGAFVAELFISL